MYKSLGRRTNCQPFAGRAARQSIRTVFSHRGDADEFLRRHREMCSELPSKARADRQRVTDHLLCVAADFRSAKIAWKKTANDPRAAGPDGIRQGDLPVHVQTLLIKMIGEQLGEGGYQAGETRRVNIPKPNGKTRPIDVSNLADSLASRMLAMATTPFLDPGLTPWCVGGRENHDREMALVWVLETAERENRRRLIAQDVQNAFPSVPRSRLRQVLLSRQLTPQTVGQIEKLIGSGKKGRGIPQGNPLSPLLLNLYLDQCLDRPWLKVHPDMPIIRYVDDVLLMLGDKSDPEEYHRELNQQVQAAGMSLKHPMEEAICDLSQGGSVDWIGYRVSWTNGTWHVGVGKSTWDNLGLRLRECHRAQNPPMAAMGVIQGWVGQQGACYHPDTVESNVTKIVRTARESTFGEIAIPKELLGLWERAYARFMARATVYSACLPAYGACDGGFADRCFTAIRGRRGGADYSSVPPHLFDKNAEFHIWTDGSALVQGNKQPPGGWAYVILNRHYKLVHSNSGCNAKTTNNRMELFAVIQALVSLPAETRVDLYTDSQYVIDCAHRSREWQQRKWRGSKGVISNHDLVSELLTLCENRYVHFCKVKGHSGNYYNDMVDHEANRQAQYATLS